MILNKQTFSALSFIFGFYYSALFEDLDQLSVLLAF